MKIFLTGGSGFIGSHFINAAHAEGHHIYALKRKSSHTRVPLYKEPDWIIGDLHSIVDKKIIKDTDIVVHLAAHSANVPYDTVDNCIVGNVLAPNAFLSQFIESKTDISFLIAGSSFEYGTAGQRYQFIPPDAPLEPTMSYPASKAMSSILFRSRAVNENLRLKYLRIFQVYGEGEVSTRLWPSLYDAARTGLDFPMTFGEQIRDFYYVKALATDLVNELDFSDVQSGKPVTKNLGSGKPQSVLEFSEYWWHFWGAKGKLLVGKLPYRENEVMRFVPLVG